MRTRLVTLVLGLAVLVLSGCGSSSSDSTSVGSTSAASTGTSTTVSLTPAKLVASAEAICAQRDAAVAAVGTSIASEGQLKRIARGRAAAEKTAFTALSKLTPTSSLEPSWAKFMDDRRVLINGWIKVSEQGLKAHHRAFSETVSAQEKMLAAAKRDHLKRCSQAD